MRRIRSRLFAVLFSVLYLAETLFFGVGHRHCGEGCAPEGAMSGCQARCCHDQHQDGRSDSKGDPASRESESPPLTPEHDEDDCLVCRHLAKPPLPVAFAEVPHVGQTVALMDWTVPTSDIASPLVTHHSRAPPA